MHYVLRRYGPYLDITQYERKTKNKKGFCVLRKKSDFGVGQRRVDSLKRTRKIFVRRVLSAVEEYGSPLLITLTFSGQASDAYFAGTALARFGRRLRDEYPNSAYVFIPELSPRGRLHFHGLLFGVSSNWGDEYIGRQLVSVGRERRERYFASGWGEGFVDVRQTNGSPKLGFYIAKYVLKAGGEVMFNAMRLLRFSRNFARETILRDPFICEKLIETAPSTRKLISNYSQKSVFLGKITKTIYVDNWL